MAARSGLSLAVRSTLAGLGVVAFVAMGAPMVSAQETDPSPQQIDTAGECIGTITASLAAESLPSGEWSAHGDCLTGDRFYEFVDGPLLAKAAVTDAVYTDGHSGRVAAGIVTLGNGIGLAIVGVEDAATGLIKWSAVLDDFHSEDDAVSVSGQGVAVFPIERATVSAELTGTGTDVKPFLDGYEADGSPEAGSPDDAARVEADPTMIPGPASAVDGDTNDTTVPPEPSTETDGTGGATKRVDAGAGGKSDAGSNGSRPVPTTTTTPGVDYGVIEVPRTSDVGS